MAASIGCWVRDTAIIENQRDIEYKKAFLNAMISTRTTLDTSATGQMKASMKDKIAEERKKMKEFGWIFKG